METIIGVVGVLLGVLIAQLVALIQSRLDRANKRDILLRTKYEELSGHVNDSLGWAMECLGATTFAVMHSGTQPLAARKAYTLALLYFPLLKPYADHYVQACVSFQMVLVEQFVPHEFLNAGAQAAKNNPERFKVAGENLRAAREAFDFEIQKHSHVYIRA